MLEIDELKIQLEEAKRGGVKVDKIYTDSQSITSHLFEYDLNFNKFVSDVIDIMNTPEEVKEKTSNVNILYFTNKCNLNCTYCYEDLPGTIPQILTKTEIENNIDKIIESEPEDVQTLIVLFGGEPTLEWENVCYAMDYAYENKRNIIFNMTTNGIKFENVEFLIEVMSNPHYTSGRLHIDISFDGLGNQDRVFHSGKKSTEIMLKVLENVVKSKMRWRLRYTINPHNYKVFREDIHKLSSLFKPLRVITSVTNTLFNEDQMNLIKYNEDLLVNDWNLKRINVPVCYLCCDTCDQCPSTKSNIVGYTTEGLSSTKDVKRTYSEFKDFKRK